MIIKTRFSPSPSGNLHYGNIRIALYSFYFAKKYNGKFILRIEDSDQKRSIKTNIKKIIKDLSWLRIKFNKNPIFQSKRLNQYNNIINYMLYKKKAYKCYCSFKYLKKIRILKYNKKEKPKYNRKCFINKNIKFNNNKFYTIRFINPKIGLIIFNDLLKEQIKINNLELDDLIIRRSNGFPTYNFSVIVDDIYLYITHVIRGEDHINNTPRQINILNALYAPIPHYAHIPILLNKNKKKITKKTKEFNIKKYIKKGFLQEPLIKYLILYDKNNYSFKIKNINKNNIIINNKKIIYFNKLFFYNNNINYLIKKLYLFNKFNNKYNIYIYKYKLKYIFFIYKKYIFTLKSIFKLKFFIFNYNYIKKYFIKNNLIYIKIKLFLILLKYIYIYIKNIYIWNIYYIIYIFIKFNKIFNLNKKNINYLLRIIITGNKTSPNIYKIIYIIEKYNILYKIKKIINHLFIKKIILNE